MKKMSLKIVTAVALCSPAFSWAAPNQPADIGNFAADYASSVVKPSADMPASCDDVKLDDTQKMQISDAMFDFKKQKNTLGADLKNSMLDLMKTFSSATSTRDDGVAAQAAVKSKMDPLMMAHNELGLKIFFDILKPEQRAPAMKCLMDMKKSKGKKNNHPHRPN